jgi:hypothetical protein
VSRYHLGRLVACHHSNRRLDDERHGLWRERFPANQLVVSVYRSESKRPPSTVLIQLISCCNMAAFRWEAARGI